MRAIEYNTEEEAIQAWNELESLCEHLHEQGTEKYTYLKGNVLILEPHEIYNEVVDAWIENKELIDYTYESDN